MAAALKITTRAEWEARAICLAQEHHLTGRARYIGQGIVEEALYQVPSRSAEGSCHVVHLYAHSGKIACTCHAGVYGRACSHAGAAIHAERMRQEAMRTRQDEGWRYWLNGGSW